MTGVGAGNGGVGTARERGRRGAGGGSALGGCFGDGSGAGVGHAGGTGNVTRGGRNDAQTIPDPGARGGAQGRRTHRHGRACDSPRCLLDESIDGAGTKMEAGPRCRESFEIDHRR